MFKRINNYINDRDFKIHMTGSTINIVNYIDIITLEESRITIKYSSGMLVILGEDLSVNKLLDSEILITGNIRNIEFK